MTRTARFAIAPLALLFVSSAWGQQPPGPTTAPAPPAGAPKPSRARGHGASGDVHYRVLSGREPGMRPELRIAPPGMWWKNPDIVQKISLSADQQKRMDDIFQQSRIQLIDLKANVEKQEVMLEPMLSANPPDTNKVLAQIDHVASARAELEKSNARMLLGIRGVLSADQWTKLQAEQRENQRFMFHFQPGPGGPGFGGEAGFRTGPGHKGPGGPRDNFAPGEPISLFTLPPLPSSGAKSGFVIGGVSPDGPDLDVHFESPEDDFDL